MQSNLTRGILCLVGGVSMNIFLGCFYLWGNIQVYVTSYLHKYDSSVNLNDTVMIGPIMTACQAIASPIGPYLLQYTEPWVIILMGTGLALTGIVASTFTTNFTAFFFLYGVFYGLGIGIAIIIPLMTSWAYFPKRKGMVSGTIIGGYGFGGFIFGYISFALVNPDNISPDYEVPGGKIFHPDLSICDRAPYMLRVNAIIWACLILISLILVRRLPEESYSKVSANEDSELNPNPSVAINAVENSLISIDPQTKEEYYKVLPSVKEALLHYKTWMIVIMALISMCQGLFTAYVFKSYGEIYIADDAFITTVGTFAAVSNGLARVYWSNLQDVFGYKCIYFTILVIQIFVGFTIQMVNKSKPLYFIWIFASFSCLGGHF